MSFLASAADERVSGVEFSADALSVTLRDGRVITVPLVWYPRLLNATVAQRKNWKVAGGGYGLHWSELDEDLSTEGLLRGAPAPRTLAFSLQADQGLSKREQHVASLIAEGMTDKKIAARLRVSESTIRIYVRRILNKLGARDRFALLKVVSHTNASSDRAKRS
jgi:DNA-binding CsgD family transcriptional regulator